MESQASCIRNELFTKMIKKVGKKKEVNLIPSVKVESAEVGGGGRDGRETLLVHYVIH